MRGQAERPVSGSRASRSNDDKEVVSGLGKLCLLSRLERQLTAERFPHPDRPDTAPMPSFKNSQPAMTLLGERPRQSLFVRGAKRLPVRGLRQEQHRRPPSMRHRFHRTYDEGVSYRVSRPGIRRSTGL
jgi:hypothetical protein